jgi:hypothetical protein
MSVTFDEFCKHFRLGAWRDDNEYRRECERSIVLHAVDYETDVERLIHYWKIAAKRCEMEHDDKRSFDQHASDVRITANFWRLLDSDEQMQFRTGRMLPYRSARIIRSRRRSGRAPAN